MELASDHDVIVVGAGILGLASAYYILRNSPSSKVLVIERLGGVGRGSTAKSAAAFRDMFTSPPNRRLAEGAIAFYEEVEERKARIGFRRIGYLWLMTADQLRGNREALEYLSSVGVVYETMDPNELKRHLPGFEMEDVSKGILGSRCGILNQNQLCQYYEQEIQRLGGKLLLNEEVDTLAASSGHDVIGVKVGGKDILGDHVVVATGAWLGEMKGIDGLKGLVAPRKRQLFSIRTRSDEHKRLLNAKGFNSHSLLPFTILPEGVYMRPAANSFIIGYSDEDRATGIEEDAKAEPAFFEEMIRPQLVRYFPSFRDRRPDHSWAGYYAYHLPDKTPFITSIGGVIVVGGTSGSGVMKADSIGRAVAGSISGKKEVELGDGRFFRIADIGLDGREVPIEEFVI